MGLCYGRPLLPATVHTSHMLLDLMEEIFPDALLEMKDGQIHSEDGHISDVLTHVQDTKTGTWIVDTSSWLIKYANGSLHSQPGRPLWDSLQPSHSSEVQAMTQSSWFSPYICEFAGKQRSCIYVVTAAMIGCKYLLLELVQIIQNGVSASGPHGPWPFTHLEQGELIGHGGFGHVYRARATDGHLVAVKVCSMYSRANTESLEVKLASSFQHSNVLTTDEHLTCTHNVNIRDVWMVMQLCTNGSLVDAVDRAYFDTYEKVLQVAQQVTSGMTYLHAMDVLHGDLSPANVLFDEGMTAKISDFGLARCNVSGTIQTRTSGAPLYAAPEIDTLGELRKDADVYSFGLLLWEMCHNKHVFHADSLCEMLALKKLNPSPAFVALRFKCFEEMIAQCTGPQNRPTFTEVHHRLCAMGSGKQGT